MIYDGKKTQYFCIECFLDSVHKIYRTYPEKWIGYRCINCSATYDSSSGDRLNKFTTTLKDFKAEMYKQGYDQGLEDQEAAVDEDVIQTLQMIMGKKYDKIG